MGKTNFRRMMMLRDHDKDREPERDRLEEERDRRERELERRLRKLHDRAVSNHIKRRGHCYSSFFVAAVGLEKLFCHFSSSSNL
jgi:hypothetical protein